MTHQFSLFNHTEARKAKVPISKERVEEAKKQLEKKDMDGLVKTLRNLNDSLQRFERKLK